MKRLMHDLRFILRNWRYFHAHGVLGKELQEWWNDYDPPKVSTHYGIHVGANIDTAAIDQAIKRAQSMFSTGARG